MLILTAACQQSSVGDAFLPAGWVQEAPAEHLPAYQRLVDDPIKTPLPLRAVLRGPRNEIIYHGVALGANAERVTTQLCANADCARSTPAGRQIVRLTPSDSTSVDLVFYDLNPTASFVLATVTSAKHPATAGATLDVIIAANE